MLYVVASIFPISFHKLIRVAQDIKRKQQDTRNKRQQPDYRHAGHNPDLFCTALNWFRINTRSHDHCLCLLHSSFHSFLVSLRTIGLIIKPCEMRASRLNKPYGKAMTLCPGLSDDTNTHTHPIAQHWRTIDCGCAHRRESQLWCQQCFSSQQY